MINFKYLREHLEEAVIYEGYIEKREKTCKSYRVYGKGDDEIILKYDVLKKNYLTYFNRDSSFDRGSCVDFFLNRLSGYLQKNEMVKDNLILLEKKVNDFKTGIVELPERVFKQTKPFLLSNFSIVPIDSTFRDTYLTGYRKILLDLSANEFENSFKAVRSENGNIRLLYCWTNETGVIRGAQFKYFDSKTKTNKKIFVEGSEKRNSVWQTSLFGKSAIFITEDPIDALSHKQLFPKSNFGYIATGGSIASEQFSLINKIIEKNKLPLILGFDNDNAGVKMSIQVIKEVLKKKLVGDISEMLELKEKMSSIVSIYIPKGKDWNEDLQKSTQKIKSLKM